MSAYKPPTKLEKTLGNPGVVAAISAAATIGIPEPVYATLIPILFNSLASERQKERQEAMLKETQAMLAVHEELIKNLSDSQFKLINDAVYVAMQTVNQEKLALLKSAIRNSLTLTEISDQESVFLGRILRDISVDEALFVIANFSFERVGFGGGGSNTSDESRRILYVPSESEDAQVVLGLFNLGLLMNASSSWDDDNLFCFSPMAAKLIAILKN